MDNLLKKISEKAIELADIQMIQKGPIKPPNPSKANPG